MRRRPATRGLGLVLACLVGAAPAASWAQGPTANLGAEDPNAPPSPAERDESPESAESLGAGTPTSTLPPPGPKLDPNLAPPVTVTTKVRPDPSQIGDLLTLEVIAAYPSGYRVNLPTGVDFAPLHLVEVAEREPEASGDGYFRKVFAITLQHFAVGEATIPGFPLTYVGPSGEVETVRVAPRSFTVDSLLANEADPQRKLEDPPISLEYPNTAAELVIYAAAIALLAGFFLALLWRRFASRPRLIAGPPPIPPDERALAALEALEGAALLEAGLVQDYYLELTEIAKGYLEGRFGIDALDRTTEEIRRELRRERTRLGPLDPEEVLRFLENCDLVKFARFDPELDEARGALGQVRTMVEETRPKASAPDPEKAPNKQPNQQPDKQPDKQPDQAKTPRAAVDNDPESAAPEAAPKVAPAAPEAAPEAAPKDPSRGGEG